MMNIDQIPTPETDAEWNSPDVCTQFPELAYAMRKKSKDLERRLALAREALEYVAEDSNISCQSYIQQTLASIAPKP